MGPFPGRKRICGEVKLWADAGFLAATLPATRVNSSTVNWAAAYGVFVLAAPAAGGIMTPARVTALATDDGCATTFAGMVLSSAAASVSAAARGGHRAEAQRQLALGCGAGHGGG